MLPTRRQLMVGGAALVVAGALDLGILPTATADFRLLSAPEIALVQAVGEALFPPGNPIGIRAMEVNLPRAVDELLADSLDPKVGALFRYTLEGLDLGTLASRGRRFSALTLPERMDVVRNWSRETVRPRRMAADALRMVLGMAFFNLPPVRATLGWAVPCEGGTV